MEILHNCKKGPMVDTLETFENNKTVKNFPDKVLNEKFESNILFDQIEENFKCFLIIDKSWSV